MSRLSKPVRWLLELGVTDQDFAQARRIRILNAVAILSAFTSLAYALGYALYDIQTFWREASFLPAMAVVYLAIFFVIHQGRLNLAMWMLICAALVHLGVVSWMLGASAGSLSYLLIVPFVLALLMGEQDRFTVWPIAAAVGALFVIVTLGFEDGSVSTLAPAVQDWIFLLNSFGAVAFSCVVAVLFRGLIRQTEAELDTERQRSDRLLHAILPAAIVPQLKTDRPGVIAQDVEAATAVFADIVGFTDWSLHTPPHLVVAELNHIFSRIDDLCAARKLEKIKTIGDAYFAVCGVPDLQPNHAARAVEFAMDLREMAQSWHSDTLESLRLRIVVASGPMVAGVIGRTKFAYDVWGNTINTAARMEHYCAPGEILLSPVTRAALPKRFLCESKGQFEIRDQGATELFRLLNVREPVV